MPTASAQVVIQNPLGLHARPAMAFVDAANGFAAQVRVIKDDQKVDGKSIMQLMMLAAVQGTSLTVEAEGDDAEAAVTELSEMLNSATEPA
ncbi:MAG: HPr family phosphocarrier protein [Planctomycetota bacterium]